jgi:hypothetical protein
MGQFSFCQSSYTPVNVKYKPLKELGLCCRPHGFDCQIEAWQVTLDHHGAMHFDLETERSRFSQPEFNLWYYLVAVRH